MLDDDNSEDGGNWTNVSDRVDSWKEGTVIVSSEDDSKAREYVSHVDNSISEEYLTTVSNEDISEDTKDWTTVPKEDSFESKEDFPSVRDDK